MQRHSGWIKVTKIKQWRGKSAPLPSLNPVWYGLITRLKRQEHRMICLGRQCQEKARGGDKVGDDELNDSL